LPWTAALLAALALGGCMTKEYTWVRAPTRAPALTPAAPRVVVAPPPPAIVVQQPTARDFINTAGDRVYFDTNLAMLSTEARNTLDRQVEWLNRYPQVPVRVEGNADRRASAQHNLTLGQRRADAVKAYLISRGIPASRITAVSNGAMQPIAFNGSPDALLRNRNVQTIVLVGGAS
jgi:peptidoglycan-associated lipoprotein